MPKLKTHKGAARRFRITGTGKVLRVKGGKSHLRRKKPARVKRLFDQMIALASSAAKNVKKVLPYGSK
ncbi:MAG: 50S ribosomal protein L35 [Chloroflexi bacterium]|nr:50S ribosomal protein L35 [Chloroflexota bacterium]